MRADLPVLLQTHCPAPHYAIVADSRVAPLLAEPLAATLDQTSAVALVTFPAGEWNKSRETWAALTDALLMRAIGRDTALVAVGGGVAGDLTGFVAATYRGGVRWAHVATTVVSMTDGAVGDVVGVHTPRGRGLVGIRNSPSLVVADVDSLATLPPVHVAAGAAVLLRAGIAADAAHFRRAVAGSRSIQERDARELTDLVTRSIEIVRDLAAYPGIRSFGRVLGGALEAAFGFELLYGEALALGMLAEATVAARRDACDRSLPVAIARSLDAFAIPTSPPDRLDIERFVDAARQHHRAASGTVSFAVPTAIGAAADGEGGIATLDASAEEIDAALQSLGW